MRVSRSKQTRDSIWYVIRDKSLAVQFEPDVVTYLEVKNNGPY